MILLNVERLDEHKTVYRELSIFKIKLSNANDSMKINKLANAYGGKVHDVKKDSIMVELTATPDQIKAFEELAKPFGILMLQELVLQLCKGVVLNEMLEFLIQH